MASTTEVTFKLPTFEPQIIETVKTFSKRDVVTPEPDPFSVDAAVAKEYGGIQNPGFKRSVTNQIKKAYQANGVQSARIDEKLITGYDVFECAPPPYNLYLFGKLYELSAPHYAAVNAKTANIVGLGFNLVNSRKAQKTLDSVASDTKKSAKAAQKLNDHKDDMLDLIDTLNEEDGFVETLTKVWRDYEVSGNGYLEIGRGKDKSIKYVGHIPAQTMRVRKKRDGFVQIASNGIAQFFNNFGESKPSPFNSVNQPNEVIHIKRYSPTNSFYGVPDIVAAQQALAGNEFASKFNLDYFENKAVPRYIITLTGAKLGPQAESDLLSFFETSLKGQNHRSIYIPLPGPDNNGNAPEIKFDRVEAQIQDGSFVQYTNQNQNIILMAHRVPITKISVSSNASVALAQDADKTFKEQVCGPEQGMFEQKLNKIIKEITEVFVLKLNEMTLTDENTQSQINERYAKIGAITRNEIRDGQGRGPIDKGDEIIDINDKGPAAGAAKSEATTQRTRDANRSANRTDSAGAARNAKGAGRKQT